MAVTAKGDYLLKLKDGKQDLELVLRPSFEALLNLETQYGLGIGTLGLRLMNRDIMLSDMTKAVHCFASHVPQQRKKVPDIEHLSKIIFQNGLLAIASEVMPLVNTLEIVNGEAEEEEGEEAGKKQ